MISVIKDAIKLLPLMQQNFMMTQCLNTIAFVGIGMSAIVDPSVADLIVRSLAARGMKAWIAGKVEKAPEMGAPRSYLASDYR